ncbi:6-carboxytetrahydropterin synthase [Streptomyces millisiae]|uniref:6-carboxy-5,6,7,8-tetrahydropterin synthase n=1 Tax=Streptomyces millisiae TaxID=3075542 RepID=A0ABU2M009_9ACTN|nr:6-carboxytetrahydropterin synthase [Streptomyces sp. DSM 44918]MDT0323168.1 hypothetical protein [Streptomyces sp. DSM 44918]
MYATEISATIRARHASGARHDFTAVLVMKSAAPRPDNRAPVAVETIEKWAENELTNRTLTEVLGASPSAERVARWVYESWAGQIPDLAETRISPEPGTWAIYRPEPE